MPKQTLTVGDIKEIEKILEMQKNASDDSVAKDKINELIKKLDKMHI